MCAESGKKEGTLQDIESLREDMKEMNQESTVTGLATLLALALAFIGLGLSFMQYPPSTYMQYYFIGIGVVLGVWAIVRYWPKNRASDKNKSKGG